MVQVPIEMHAAARARWLAELSEALEQAHKLMWKLGIGESGGPAAMELYLRVEAARLEVHSLRIGRGSALSEEPAAEWTESSPWKRGALSGG